MKACSKTPIFTIQFVIFYKNLLISYILQSAWIIPHQKADFHGLFRTAFCLEIPP
jgi:hypothetical protein